MIYVAETVSEPVAAHVGRQSRCWVNTFPDECHRLDSTCPGRWSIRKHNGRDGQSCQTGEDDPNECDRDSDVGDASDDELSC